MLVTRNGGFSALARKLHELGKTVVVCADAGCSAALRAVADVFIELPKPGEGLPAVDEEPRAAASKAESELLAPSEQILDETRAKVLEEVEQMARADGERLDREGIPLTTVGQHFASSVPLLGVVRSGYPGLREFLQWALVGTPYCVISKLEGPQDARLRLGHRSRARRGFSQLPNLERRPRRHFADQANLYRFLASQGGPTSAWPIPDRSRSSLSRSPTPASQDEELSAVTDRVAAALSGTVAAADVKGADEIYLEVATAVTVFILAGRYFEARSKRRAGAAITALLELSAKDAAILGADGAERRVPVEQLAVSDRFVVRPGEKIATDGIVEEGMSAVDQSC